MYLSVSKKVDLCIQEFLNRFRQKTVMSRYTSSKDTVESSKRIELSVLKKLNYLNGHVGGKLSWSCNGEPTGNINIIVKTSSDSPSIQLDYKARRSGTEEWKNIKYSLSMESLPCTFGGKRWFFICGLYKGGKYCGRRVRNLYQAGDYFGCRKCADLTYESCNESKRFKTGFWGIVTRDDKAVEYYDKYVKRHYYNGKPTKAYKRYLKMVENN